MRSWQRILSTLLSVPFLSGIVLADATIRQDVNSNYYVNLASTATFNNYGGASALYSTIPVYASNLQVIASAVGSNPSFFEGSFGELNLGIGEAPDGTTGFIIDNVVVGNVEPYGQPCAVIHDNFSEGLDGGRTAFLSVLTHISWSCSSSGYSGRLSASTPYALRATLGDETLSIFHYPATSTTTVYGVSTSTAATNSVTLPASTATAQAIVTAGTGTITSTATRTGSPAGIGARRLEKRDSTVPAYGGFAVVTYIDPAVVVVTVYVTNTLGVTVSTTTGLATVTTTGTVTTSPLTSVTTTTTVPAPAIVVLPTTSSSSSSSLSTIPLFTNGTSSTTPGTGAAGVAPLMTSSSATSTSGIGNAIIAATNTATISSGNLAAVDMNNPIVSVGASIGVAVVIQIQPTPILATVYTPIPLVGPVAIVGAGSAPLSVAVVNPASPNGVVVAPVVIPGAGTAVSGVVLSTVMVSSGVAGIAAVPVPASTGSPASMVAAASATASRSATSIANASVIKVGTSSASRTVSTVVALLITLCSTMTIF